MKRHHVTVIVSAVVFAAVALFAWQAIDEPAPEASGAASEVRSAELFAATLPDLDGVKQPLSQWQGKVLVINFWAPWCPPCREEIPGFVHLQDKHGEHGLQFIGIALDEPDKVQAFMDESGINYPILLGGAEAVGLNRAAGNRLGGLPYTVVLDRQGKAVATFTGLVEEPALEALITPLL